MQSYSESGIILQKKDADDTYSGTEFIVNDDHEVSLSSSSKSDNVKTHTNSSSDISKNAKVETSGSSKMKLKNNIIETANSEEISRIGIIRKVEN